MKVAARPLDLPCERRVTFQGDILNCSWYLQKEEGPTNFTLRVKEQALFLTLQEHDDDDDDDEYRFQYLWK